ncbi:MAG: thiamine pyrophosphate-dependent enzyme [Patescibacteria group bacterium]
MPQKYQNPFNHLLAPGHRGCAGCGELLAARHVIDALGKETIVVSATGCLEVTTTPTPHSSWKVPWIHSLFENAPSVASGVLAALQARGDKKTTVAVFAGDGSTFDIGFGALSGLWTRHENIIYICFDNEAYMNTGNQYSGSTPLGAATTTTPNTIALGNEFIKKDLPAIAAAHGVPYIATSTIGFPEDITAKIKKAMTFSGPKYIQILVGCVPGWGYESELTVSLGKLAQKSGHYPVFEMVDGKIKNVMKIPQKPVAVEEYLRPQKRFAHLFKTDNGNKRIATLQKVAEENIIKYQLK